MWPNTSTMDVPRVQSRPSAEWQMRPLLLTLGWRIGVTKRTTGGVSGYRSPNSIHITHTPPANGVPAGPSHSTRQKAMDASLGKISNDGCGSRIRRRISRMMRWRRAASIAVAAAAAAALAGACGAAAASAATDASAAVTLTQSSFSSSPSAPSAASSAAASVTTGRRASGCSRVGGAMSSVTTSIGKLAYSLSACSVRT
mmetsp:Transcript_22275/g.78060  ORF Transcript_22275/g.78060 Transcript_22275/m.78060 type:complete len:200 (+) Transcript_22275:424-1023(+)